MKPCKHPCCPDKGPCKKVSKAKPRKRIKQVSTQQAKRIRQYTAQKQVEFTGEDVCAVALLENKSDEVIRLFQACTYHATQKHHDAGRIGDHLFDTGIKVCGTCHRVIEDHPNLAKSLGLSSSRLIKQQKRTV